MNPEARGVTHAAALVSLANAYEQYYPEGVRAEMGERLEASSEVSALAQAALRLSALEALLEAEPQVCPALMALMARGGRARASRLRRASILQGWGDVERGLEALIVSGLVILHPAPGLRQWSLSEVVAARRHLQRELSCPAAALTWLTEKIQMEAPRSHFAVPDEGVTVDAETSVEGLERNLLHLVSLLDGDEMALNKDKSPNRRSLLRFVRDLHLPGLGGEEAPELSSSEVAEPVHHLLSLATSLGMLTLERGRLETDYAVSASFFNADEAARDRLLSKALRNQAIWNESASWAAMRSSSVEPVRSLEARHEGLAGPRGQIFGDLVQLPMDGWCDAGQVAEVLLALDRGYLSQSLGGRTPRDFIMGVLLLGLVWAGVFERGETAAGAKVVRWTERGRRLLTGASVSGGDAGVRPPPLIVQPNLEVTVFTAEASLSVLHTLYQIGERQRGAGHVAIFQLDALRVKRAYGRDTEAEALVTFLTQASRTPLPANVAFTLRDWQRVQRKLTFYVRGALLQWPSADRLEVVADTLEHDPGHETPVVRVGHEALFLPDSEGERLSRVMDTEAMHRVDYDAAPPPCFRDLGRGLLEELATGVDFITRHDIKALAAPEPPSDGGAARWRLTEARMLERWPTETVEHALAFLEPRLVGGVTPRLDVELRAMVDGLGAQVMRGVTVVRLDDEHTTEKLLEAREADGLIAHRLGPSAVLVAPGAEEALEALLRALGLEVETTRRES